MKITQTGPGLATHGDALTDYQGSGSLPIQVTVSSPTATYRIVGKASQEAPWFPLTTAISGEFLEALYWLPYVGLEVLSGDTAEITLWVAEH
jgi:hypothetical protein